MPPAVPPTEHPPHHVQSGTPNVRRTVTMAQRAAKPAPGAKPPVWQPWEQVMDGARAQLKMEITEALKVLQAGLREADKILDVSEAEARQAGGTLRAAAWAQWHRLMDSADKTEDAILDPAAKAYERRIGELHDDYDRALSRAESAHKQVIADAERAKTDGQG